MNTKIDAVAVLREADGLKVLRPGTVGYTVALSAVEKALRIASEGAATERASTVAKDGGQAGDVIADLAMLVRRLVRRLEKDSPGTDLAPQAIDFLKRKGLQGSPLREEATAAPSGRQSDPATFPVVVGMTPEQVGKALSERDGATAAPSGSIVELPPLSPTLRNTYSSLTERSHEELVKEYAQACIAAVRAARTPPAGIDAAHVPAPQAGQSDARDAVVVLWNGTGEQLQKADDALRSLSSYVGQGGCWDAENLDYDEMEKRIKEGFDTIIKVESERLDRAATPSQQGAETPKEGGAL